MTVSTCPPTCAGNPGSRGRGTHAGQAIVEFAGGATVLLLLVLGLMEVAPPVVRTAQLTQAVRAGAAYARIAPTDTFGIRKRVVLAVPAIYGSLTDAQIAAMTDSQIAVTCAAGLAGPSKSCSSAGVGDSVTVTATYSYSGTLTSLFSTILDAPLDITRAAMSEIY
jgi:Flp pilus assembly protein TadG